MTSLSQSEINGADTEPFRVDLDALLNREEKAVPADTKDIFERIYRGSMPAIASGKNTNSQIFYSSYLSTYIERDVKELSDAIDALKFLRFMTAVATRCSQIGEGKTGAAMMAIRTGVPCALVISQCTLLADAERF